MTQQQKYNVIDYATRSADGVVSPHQVAVAEQEISQWEQMDASLDALLGVDSEANLITSAQTPITPTGLNFGSNLNSNSNSNSNQIQSQIQTITPVTSSTNKSLAFERQTPLAPVVPLAQNQVMSISSNAQHVVTTPSNLSTTGSGRAILQAEIAGDKIELSSALGLTARQNLQTVVSPVPVRDKVAYVAPKSQILKRQKERPAVQATPKTVQNFVQGAMQSDAHNINYDTMRVVAPASTPVLKTTQKAKSVKKQIAQSMTSSAPISNSPQISYVKKEVESKSFNNIAEVTIADKPSGQTLQKSKVVQGSAQKAKKVIDFQSRSNSKLNSNSNLNSKGGLNSVSVSNAKLMKPRVAPPVYQLGVKMPKKQEVSAQIVSHYKPAPAPTTTPVLPSIKTQNIPSDSELIALQNRILNLKKRKPVSIGTQYNSQQNIQQDAMQVQKIAQSPRLASEFIASVQQTPRRNFVKQSPIKAQFAQANNAQTVNTFVGSAAPIKPSAQKLAAREHVALGSSQFNVSQPRERSFADVCNRLENQIQKPHLAGGDLIVATPVKQVVQKQVLKAEEVKKSEKIKETKEVGEIQFDEIKNPKSIQKSKPREVVVVEKNESTKNIAQIEKSEIIPKVHGVEAAESIESIESIENIEGVENAALTKNIDDIEKVQKSKKVKDAKKTQNAQNHKLTEIQAQVKNKVVASDVSDIQKSRRFQGFVTTGDRVQKPLEKNAVKGVDKKGADKKNNNKVENIKNTKSVKSVKSTKNIESVKESVGRTDEGKPSGKSAKMLAGLVMAAAVAVFAFALADKGLAMVSKVKQSSAQGMSNFLSAVDAATNQDFARAEYDFGAAYKQFARARTSFDSINNTVISLTSYVPFLSQMNSGKYAMEAGMRLARAGEHISDAAKALKGLGNPMDGNRSILAVYQKISASVARAEGELRELEPVIAQINTADVPSQYRDKFVKLKQKLPVALAAFTQFRQNSEVVRELLGANGPRKYLFLFQNNNEMRATGGFIGSYGRLDIADGRVKKFFIDGIFNPNGQLIDKIVPPKPIQKISATWSLHDSNWFPDFALSATKAMEFYERTGGPTVDGVIAITPQVLIELLRITGPVELPEYDTVITADNLMPALQKEVEVDYDKEENRPKKILSDLAPMVLERVMSMTDGDGLRKVMDVVGQMLAQKHVLMYANDDKIQKMLDDAGWAGTMIDTERDYLSVINTNINGYKTDGVIEQRIEHTAEIAADGSIIDIVRIVRKHTGGLTPYEWWNKVNANYMRVYVPEGAELLSVSGQTREFVQPPLEYKALGFEFDKDVVAQEKSMKIDDTTGTRTYVENGKTVFANWVYVSPQETVTVEYRYRLPFGINLRKLNGEGDNEADVYAVVFQKQSGAPGSELVSNIKLPDNMRRAWQYPTTAKGSEWISNTKTDRFRGIVIAPR